MDIYVGTLLLGAVGLGAMAASGLAHYGHGGTGRGHGRGHVRGHARSHAHRGSHARGSTAARLAHTLTSPRFLFSVALGVGLTGTLLRSLLGGAPLSGVALAGGLLFERVLVRPLSDLLMRFASNPALTLESCIADEATAVTSFDGQGHGIVSLELDGQIVQLLATLRASDREIGGRVRAGARVRIDDVDAMQNRCIVSLI